MRLRLAALMVLALTIPTLSIAADSNQSLVERFVRSVYDRSDDQPRSFMQDRIVINRLNDPDQLLDVEPGAYLLYLSGNDVEFGPITSHRCRSVDEEKVDCQFRRSRGRESAEDAQSFFVREGRIYRIAITPPARGAD